MKPLSGGTSERKAARKDAQEMPSQKKERLAARCSLPGFSRKPCGAALTFLVFVSDLGRWSRRVVGLDFPRLSQSILAAAPTASIISPGSIASVTTLSGSPCPKRERRANRPALQHHNNDSLRRDIEAGRNAPVDASSIRLQTTTTTTTAPSTLQTSCSRH